MPDTCFVIQGFHKKTDYPTGRTLDLDASYEVIKDAVITAGLLCVRADEIRHSGTIDTPMFEQILSADVVIADLSTYNVNAAYELGVRHALRPYTTIIVAENQLKYPFDFSHIAIQTYEHLGSDIGRREAERFKKELVATIQAIMAAKKTDSPVYTFVPGLTPPQAPPAPAAAASTRGLGMDAPASLKERIDEARALVRGNDFVEAKKKLLELRAEMQQAGTRDDSLAQLLVLATYKSALPTPEAALMEAKGYLAELGPLTSRDTETLGLWGSVHKRLWDRRQDMTDLNEAIRGYERGFQLRQDYYNGINYAFLLNVRSQRTAATQPAEAIADWVLAERVRRQVIDICMKELAELPAITDSTSPEEAKQLRERRYWILATLREAATGIGDDAAAAKWAQQANELSPAAWMVETTITQISALKPLLASPPTSRLQ
jgi:hypothetical protein